MISSGLVADTALSFFEEQPIFFMNVPVEIDIRDVLAYPLLDAKGVCALQLAAGEFLFYYHGHPKADDVIRSNPNAEVFTAPSVSTALPSKHS